MSGTPEKILEHLLETVKLDSNGNDAIRESLLIVYLLYSVIPDNQTLSTSLSHVCCCDVCPPLQIPV